MNQIPTNAPTNGEGAPAEQAAAAPARPRRARRPAAHAKTQAQKSATQAQTQAHAPAQPQPLTAPAPQQPAAETPAPARPRRAAARSKSRAAAEQPSQQPAAQAQPAPPPLEQPHQPAAAAAGAETGVQPQPAKRTRARSHRGGRKNAVQLVKPETPAGEAASTIPSGEMPQAEAAGTRMAPAEPASIEAHEAPEGVRTVPVVTEALAGVAPPLPTPQGPPAAPEAPAKRYRFERRGPAAAIPGAAPSARPERLSGPATEAAAHAEPVPFTTLREHAPAEEREELATAPEEEPEAWRATVAEVAPETLAHTAAETRAEEAVEDLVSALGLRPLVPSGPSAEEAEAAEEAGEEAAEAEMGAEAQATTRRPRRRRRGGRGGATAGEEAGEGTPISPVAEPEWPAVSESRNGFERHAEISPFEQPYSPYHRPARERNVPAAEAERFWEAGPTEAPRPSEAAFGSPEPQMARGFGPQPRGVAGPAPSSFQRAPRERGVDVPPMSPNQLGTLVTHAIQQQTDRLLNELRYQPQGPSMTVALPMPTTERIGVFVDVANLHYSARTQRITLDFGKLLEFLRGNRRLIRAQAYAPTNPEPGAEQTFLSAVRGLGYRITTKNFKTFASGAKKADMDLDLCMDIVRLVDAGALDTVVLVSGDSDFLPLLEYCSDHGVRVEVAAFDDSAAMILRQSCDLFINLSLVEGIQTR